MRPAGSCGAGDLEVVVSEALFGRKVTITLELAKQLADTARREITARGFSMFVVITGDDAVPLVVERVNGAQAASYEIAVEKARAAARFRRPTKAFEDRILKDGRVNLLSMPGIVAVEGGAPLFVEAQIVGAVGVSGGTGVEDGEVAAVVVAALAEISGKSASSGV
jgi:uncharacterized protein GlcG (DUF336 family)